MNDLFVPKFNAITAFVDASNVYGSDDATASDLRSFTDGKLKSSFVRGREVMPEDDQGVLFGGDIRVPENPGLSSLHTLFLREHNRIAEEIKAVGPNMNDEDIYQEAR